jgi:AraC-like DNA-binding protein
MPAVIPVAAVHAPIRKVLESSDPDRIDTYLSSAYATRSRTSDIPQGSTCRLENVDVGAVTLQHARQLQQVTCRLDPVPGFVVTYLRAGTMERVLDDRRAGTHRITAGDVLLGVQPGQSGVAHAHDPDVHSVTVAPSLLDHVVGAAPDRSATSLRFTGYRPVSPHAADHWVRTYRYVSRLLDNPEAAAHPLVLGSATRLLAAALLATFPSTASADTGSQDRRDATSATLHRAITYIEAHPDQDVSVADIAAAACVTVRAVQLAFRRHLDTTPMAYLRRVRLTVAHQDLLQADPQNTTVAQVANRWGFTSHSRFAALYRCAYHELPSSTLHRPITH